MSRERKKRQEQENRSNCSHCDSEARSQEQHSSQSKITSRGDIVWEAEKEKAASKGDREERRTEEKGQIS